MTLADVVANVDEALDGLPQIESEILLVDDGSSDGSADLAVELAAKWPRVRIHQHPTNLGFAEVQRSCYRVAQHEWVFIFPADGELNPQVIETFVNAAATNDLILGVPAYAVRQQHRLLSQGYHRVIELLFRHRLGPFGACLLVRRTLALSGPNRARTPVAMTEMVMHALTGGAAVTSLVVDKDARQHGETKSRRTNKQIREILLELGRLYIEAGPHRRRRALSQPQMRVD